MSDRVPRKAPYPKWMDLTCFEYYLRGKSVSTNEQEREAAEIVEGVFEDFQKFYPYAVADEMWKPFYCRTCNQFTMGKELLEKPNDIVMPEDACKPLEVISVPMCRFFKQKVNPDRFFCANYKANNSFL